MEFALYTDVILVQDVPKEGLHAGDVGVVVERHDVVGREPGYSVEFFDMLGSTVAGRYSPCPCTARTNTSGPTDSPVGTGQRIGYSCCPCGISRSEASTHADKRDRTAYGVYLVAFVLPGA